MEVGVGGIGVAVGAAAGAAQATSKTAMTRIEKLPLKRNIVVTPFGRG